MDFDQFFCFYKDFGLFPDIVNMLQLKNIFFSLADLLRSHYFDKTEEEKVLKESQLGTENTRNDNFENKIKEMLKKNEFLNFDLFLDSLAISSTFMKFNEQFDDIEKVTSLLIF